MKKIVSSVIYLEKLISVLNQQDKFEIDEAIRVIKKSWKDGRQIITLGNGGSSLTALHYINDWNKSIFMETGVPFRGRSLVDNIGLITSYSNDISFEDIFIEQLKNILTTGDLVIAISGSGNSENVIRAVDYANENGAKTLGICGYDGGRLKKQAQNVVWVNVNDMQIVEDIHSIFGHIVMRNLCECTQA
jgi:D-sedoheptulose 7-phosphate isomerase